MSVLISIALSPLPLKAHGHLLVGLGVMVGYELGKWIDPDWDLMGTTASEGRMVNELPILGHFLFGVSSAYGSMFRAHHRSFWTHFPFISTFIRYLWVFWWIWYEIYRSNIDWAWLIFIFIGAYIGTSLSDTIHWWLDNHYGE